MDLQDAMFIVSKGFLQVKIYFLISVFRRLAERFSAKAGVQFTCTPAF
jgi:hypothetical protein